MVNDRLFNVNKAAEISAIEEFAAQAYSREAPILIADGMPEEVYPQSKPAAKAPEQPAERPAERPIEMQRQPLFTPPPERLPPAYCAPPPLIPQQQYYYRPGTMHCRRVYAPVLPVLPHPIDMRKTYRHPDNPVVQATLNTVLQLEGHPILDSHPSEISRQDPSATFLNMVLQKVIGRQTMGNTIDEIAYRLDDKRDPTNHFNKLALGQVVPGDIIIAYPKGDYAAEAAVYLGNSRVACYDPSTKRISTTDSINSFYPPKDPTKAIYDRVNIYRWADWKSGY